MPRPRLRLVALSDMARNADAASTWTPRSPQHGPRGGLAAGEDQGHGHDHADHEDGVDRPALTCPEQPLLRSHLRRLLLGGLLCRLQTHLTAKSRPSSKGPEFPSPARRSLGHGPQRRRSLLVADAGQRGKARRGQRRLLDRHGWVLLEETEQPTRCNPWVTTGLLAGDEDRELKRIYQGQLRQVLRPGQRHEDVAALEGPLERCVWVTGRARSASSVGAGRLLQLSGRGELGLSPADRQLHREVSALDGAGAR
jgi:hypothetical protein